MKKAEILAAVARADHATPGEWARVPDVPGAVWMIQDEDGRAELTKGDLTFLENARRDVLTLADYALGLRTLLKRWRETRGSEACFTPGRCKPESGCLACKTDKALL